MDCEEIVEQAKQAKEKGEIKEAIELYKQAVECFDKAGQSEQATKTLCLLGEAYRIKKDYFSAASAYKDAIMRYSFSGNIKAAEDISKRITEEEIKSSKTFQIAINFMKEKANAASVDEEELIYEEPLTDQEMETALKEIDKKIQIAPADDKIYEIIGGKTDNFIPATEKIQLKGRPSANQLQRLLLTVLESKRVKIKNEIISTITAKKEKGDFEVSFKTSIEKDDSENVAKISFENSYEVPLKNAILTCYIPAYYSVEKIDSPIQPKMQPTLEGVEASFDLKLQPKEKISVNFTLRRNISRTVIIAQGKEIWVIRTHVPIIQETSTRFTSHLTFLNKAEKKMNNVILEDVIPLEFSIVEIFPRNLQPYAQDIEDTLLQHILSNFGKNDKFETTYVLAPRKTIRIIEKQLQLKDGRNIGRLTKITEPINKQGESTALVNIEFKNTTHTDLKNVKIKDRIPITLNLIKATINPEITKTEKMYYLSWKFGKIMNEQTIEISYLAEGKETPYKEIPEIELEEYQTHESRHISTDRYQGIIKESRELVEFKKQLTS
jgi:tetratricopeptide (TPR) repeat protein